jgi:hypothetical protein
MNLLTFTKNNLDYVKNEIIKTAKWVRRISVIKEKNLDSTERALRDKLGVNDLKNELKILRKWKNIKIIEEKEREIANKIINILYTEYPYQDTDLENGYQPSIILKTKQIYCVWFSLIWHSLLKELWIKHEWLDWLKHSALKLIIWWNDYLFDVTLYGDIKKIKKGRWKKLWIYKEIILNDCILKNPMFFYSGDPEKILFSQILWNKAETITCSKKRLEIYEKIIKINPKFSLYFNNKRLFFKSKKQHYLYRLYQFTYNILEWKIKWHTIFLKNRKEKKQIENFIKKEDFNWLRKYLLGVENKFYKTHISL